MSKIRMESGSEGPAHDPYHWERVTVSRPDCEVSLRTGALSAPVLEIDGLRVEYGHDDGDEAKAIRAFEAIAGLPYHRLVDAYHEARSRCRCGGRATVSERGYPGETFNCCERCGEIVSSDFDESAII